MEFWDFFGIVGLVLGAGAYARIQTLEKKLKSLGVLEEDFSSEDGAD